MSRQYVFAAVASVFAALTAVFTAVAAENNDETAVTKTADTSVKFSSHRSKISFSDCKMYLSLCIIVEGLISLASDN